ncbi:molybdopterin-containing oxidoreductase family protein [Desertimonas flava]|uniref:molybdopterin-containing oxidoreductase family protein n=1 Tax=Desertimonas flava TaxID=2064846 RepID=UPI0013C3FC80|nr:molybdopterin oxidoreductase family protein [Desertimonas flava]
MTANQTVEATRPTNGGATRVVSGTCHHDCPDSCGWHVTVTESDTGPVAVKMRGNPDHPYSQGELCPKVNRFIDRVYSPDRILTPLRRVGPKGEARFEAITWDEALAAIAERLHDVIDTYGPEAVLPFSDAGNQSLLSVMGMDSRFFHHMGASRLVRALCGPTVGAGISMTNGTGRTLDPMQLEHSRLIVIWGSNTRLTNRHLWPTIEAARAAGARIVVIDPLRTITAEAADEFIQPLPGTDVALMLAMMHVLIRDGLVDRAWVDDHTIGFDELAAHVASWTPQRAAEICGLDVDVIERLATDYGTIRPAAIRSLIGAEHHTNGAMFYRTLAVLPALVGAWHDVGGGLSRSVGTYQDELVDEAALFRSDLLAGREPRWLNMSRLGEALTDPALDPPVQAMVVWNANPLVTVPNAELTRRGLARDDLFTVVHEQFLTDTARYADIVLPAATQIEITDVVPAWGHLWMGWNEAAIPPRGESCSNTELFRRLAGAMGYTEPALFDDDETLLEHALGAKVDLARLRADGWVRVPYPDDGRPFGSGVFPTSSGRVELVSERLRGLGQPALPDFVPPAEGPHGDPELRSRYPLQLMTPKHHSRFLNSSYSQLPKHGPAEGQPFVELSGHDAAIRGLADGDLAEVFNDRASVRVPVRIGNRVRPGVVSIPWGWWASQHPDGRSANALTNDTLTDWGGGVAYSDTLVEVRAT